MTGDGIACRGIDVVGRIDQSRQIAVVSSESGIFLEEKRGDYPRHGKATGYGENTETAFFPEGPVIDPGKKQQYRRQYSAGKYP